MFITIAISFFLVAFTCVCALITVGCTGNWASNNHTQQSRKNDWLLIITCWLLWLFLFWLLFHIEIT